MPDLQRVHRFRDYAVAGVNWRPTRFVDEVPSSRVCGLCCMIPKRILVLPCGHVLCQSCHAASSQGGRCPLDQHPFDEAECCAVDFPVGKAKPLKVHCWNEAHGCNFEGAVEFVLRHYEDECTFHTVDCLRCGEQVLHRELSTHYVAGCGAALSLTGTKNTSSKSRAMTLQDVTAALLELKTLLTNDHKQLLLAIQCSMNEVIGQIRSQEYTFAVSPHNVAAPVQALRHSQVGTQSPSTSLPKRTSRRNKTEDASTSSASCSKKPAVPRRPEPFADVPQAVMNAMRNTSTQDYPKHAITYIRRGVKCQLELTGPLSTTRTWTTVREIVTYAVTVENVPTQEKLLGTNIAYMTVLHTRDSYFTVQLYVHGSKLGVRIQFHGTHCGFPFRAPLFKLDLSQTFPAGSSGHGRNCKCYAPAEATSLRTDSETQTDETMQICLLERNVKFEIRISPEGHA
ncbi:uncharacterized protein LOC119407289 isoform X6 [Rhipicephalus sanguineus]|uniref:uncharacterized protein LOC119407289 isoform X6 n=1 Tax=Rhipicephalus sanguineus TaxID=34632 RepID=UPI0020C37DEB|nr:uncharacterized protein LOC119407289 isoform X6 [Rhipicephalus sanguineus]